MMSSELFLWLNNKSKIYFEKHANLVSNAYVTLSRKKRRQPVNSSKQSSPNIQNQYTSNNSTDKKNNEKKKSVRAKSYSFDTSVDTKLQRSFTQLNVFEGRIDNRKQNKEVNKVPYQVKKVHFKGLIDSCEGVGEIIAAYQKNFTYLNNRVARTDKRDLIRIAQEVQALQKSRRTCLPIIKLPHNLIMPPPSTTDYQKFENKKTEVIRTTVSAEISRPAPSISPEILVPKKRKIFTIKDKDKGTLNNLNKEKEKDSSNKLVEREYLPINTVNLSFQELPNITTKISPRSFLPNLHRKLVSGRLVNERSKQITPAILTTPFGEKTLSFNENNDFKNPISRILIRHDEYKLTINKNGQDKDINVLLPPPDGTSYKENLTISVKKLGKKISRTLDKEPKYGDNYKNLLKPVLVSTTSGTSFEIRPTNFFSSPNFYNKARMLNELVPVSGRKYNC